MEEENQLLHFTNANELHKCKQNFGNTTRKYFEEKKNVTKVLNKRVEGNWRLNMLSDRGSKSRTQILPSPLKNGFQNPLAVRYLQIFQNQRTASGFWNPFFRGSPCASAEMSKKGLSWNFCWPMAFARRQEVTYESWMRIPTPKN